MFRTSSATDQGFSLSFSDALLRNEMVSRHADRMERRMAVNEKMANVRAAPEVSGFSKKSHTHARSVRLCSSSVVKLN